VPYCGLALSVVPVVGALVVCLPTAGGDLHTSSVGLAVALTWFVPHIPSPAQAQGLC